MSFNNPDIIEAMWVIDSETSREFLINLRTSEIIAERVDGKIVNPDDPLNRPNV